MSVDDGNGWNGTYDLFVSHNIRAERVDPLRAACRVSDAADLVADQNTHPPVGDNDAKYVCGGCNCAGNALQGYLYLYCKCDTAWHTPCFAQNIRGGSFSCIECETEYYSIDRYVNPPATKQISQLIAQQQAENAYMPSIAEKLQVLADAHIVDYIHGRDAIYYVNWCCWVFLSPIVFALGLYLLVTSAAVSGYMFYWLPYASSWGDLWIYFSTTARDILTLKSGWQIYIGVLPCVGACALCPGPIGAALLTWVHLRYPTRMAYHFCQLLRLGVSYAKSVSQTRRRLVEEYETILDDDRGTDTIRETYFPRPDSPTLFARSSSWNDALQSLTDSTRLAPQFKSFRPYADVVADRKRQYAAAVSRFSRARRCVEVCASSLQEFGEKAYRWWGLPCLYGCTLTAVGGLCIATVLLLPTFTIIPLMRSSSVVYDVMPLSHLAPGVLAGDCSWSRESPSSCWHREPFRELNSGTAVWVPTQHGWVAAIGVEESGYDKAPSLRILTPPKSTRATVTANFSLPWVALLSPLTPEEVALYLPADVKAERFMWCVAPVTMQSQPQVHLRYMDGKWTNLNSSTAICALPHESQGETQVRVVHECISNLYGDRSFQVRSPLNATIARNLTTGPSDLHSLYDGHTWWGYLPLRGERMEIVEFAPEKGVHWLDLRSGSLSSANVSTRLSPSLERAELDALTLQVGWERTISRILSWRKTPVDQDIHRHQRTGFSSYFRIHRISDSVVAVKLSEGASCASSIRETPFKVFDTSEHHSPILATQHLAVQPWLSTNTTTAPLTTAHALEVRVVEHFDTDLPMQVGTSVLSVGLIAVFCLFLCITLPFLLLTLMVIVILFVVAWSEDISSDYKWLLWEAPASVAVAAYKLVAPLFFPTITIAAIVYGMRVDWKVAHGAELFMVGLSELLLWGVLADSFQHPTSTHSQITRVFEDSRNAFCTSKTSVRERFVAVLSQIYIYVVAVACWVAVPLYIATMLRTPFRKGVECMVESVHGARHTVALPGHITEVLFPLVTLLHPRFQRSVSSISTFLLLLLSWICALRVLIPRTNSWRLTLPLLAPFGLARFYHPNRLVQRFLNSSVQSFRTAHDGLYSAVFTWVLEAPLTPWAHDLVSSACDDEENIPAILERRRIVTDKVLSCFADDSDDRLSSPLPDVEAVIESGTNVVSSAAVNRRRPTTASTHSIHGNANNNVSESVLSVRAITWEALSASGCAVAYAIFVMLLQGCCFWILLLPLARGLTFAGCRIMLEQGFECVIGMCDNDLFACCLSMLLYAGLGIHGWIWQAFHGMRVIAPQLHPTNDTDDDSGDDDRDTYD